MLCITHSAAPYKVLWITLKNLWKMYLLLVKLRCGEIPLFHVRTKTDMDTSPILSFHFSYSTKPLIMNFSGCTLSLKWLPASSEMHYVSF